VIVNAGKLSDVRVRGQEDQRNSKVKGGDSTVGPTQATSQSRPALHLRPGGNLVATVN